MKTFTIICNPFLSADERWNFYTAFEDAYGFMPFFACRIKTSNV